MNHALCEVVFIKNMSWELYNVPLVTKELYGICNLVTWFDTNPTFRIVGAPENLGTAVTHEAASVTGMRSHVTLLQRCGTWSQ